MNRLTVVIPTYNRCDTLKKAILAYLSQRDLRDLNEILVIDDGSRDGTADVVAGLSQGLNIPLRYFQQKNKGPAAARNVGIREATTDLILFTDDDIIPSPTFVAEHIKWHSRFPEPSAAVLGHVTWSPDLNPTPFMQWYGVDGALFDYARLEGRIEVKDGCFYTCNLSMKTGFLRQNGVFDEDFKSAAGEDIELGYRLRKAGLRLFYNRDALAYHQQYVSFTDACCRSRKAAAAVEVLKRKEAGRHCYPPPGRKQRLVERMAKLVAPALSPFRPLMDSRVPFPWTVYRVMFRTFCWPRRWS